MSDPDFQAKSERVLAVCRDLSGHALLLRLGLLRDGWAVDHPLCLALDDVAREWATRFEAQRRAQLRAFASTADAHPTEGHT